MWEGKFWPTSGVVRIYKLSPTLLQKYFTRAHNKVKSFLEGEGQKKTNFCLFTILNHANFGWGSQKSKKCASLRNI